LSKYPGRTFEDPENVFISIHQAQVGLNGNNRKVFWIPKNLEFDQVDEEEYREFLSTLDFGIVDDNFILLKGDPQTLDTDIIKMIPFPKVQTKRNGILIVHHSKDEDGAVRVRELARARNIPAQYSTSGEESPDSNLKILADQLKDVEQVVVVVGYVNNEWANERAKHILSTIIQKDYHLDSINFFFTKGAKEVFRFNGRFLPVKTLEELNGEADTSSWDGFLNPENHDRN
jgi:hypothetical protein